MLISVLEGLIAFLESNWRGYYASSPSAFQIGEYKKIVEFLRSGVSEEKGWELLLAIPLGPDGI